MARRSNGTGRGALNIAQRPVPLRSGCAAVGVGRGREIAETAVRPDCVVVVLPDCQRLARMTEGDEQRLVQELIAQPSVEALDKGVLYRLARRDVVPFDLALLRPAQDREAGQ